jgi:hypothetical protein
LTKPIGARRSQPPTNCDRLQALPSGDGRFVSLQTGGLLVVMGSLLMKLYPFREHVDPQTGEMLVKIRRKLTGE